MAKNIPFAFIAKVLLEHSGLDLKVCQQNIAPSDNPF
jgi:hypothetical protein